MKVDIWSDVRCPFCYIGKRKFETALSQFEHKDQVEVEWHSFELDPMQKPDQVSILWIIWPTAMAGLGSGRKKCMKM